MRQDRRRGCEASCDPSTGGRLGQMPSMALWDRLGKLRSSNGPRPLRAYLAVIVLVALLPALGVGATGAWLAMGSYQQAFDDRLRDTARAVSLGLRREIASHVSTLATLATSPLLDGGIEGDLSAFHAHAVRAAETVGSPIRLIGLDMRIHLDTDRPLGEMRPLTAAGPVARATLASGRPAVSDLLRGSNPDRPFIIVTVPVLREGQVIAIVGTRVWPETLSRLLAAPGLSGGAVASIVDSRRVITARSQDANLFMGRRAPEWLIKAMDGKEAGLASGHTLEGDGVRLAFQSVGGESGWMLSVLEPMAAYTDSWRPPIVTLLLGGLAVFALALAFAMWLGNRVLRPIAMLQRQAEAVAAGEGGRALLSSPALQHRADVAEFEALREAIGRAGEIMEASVKRNRALAEAGAAALWRARADGYIVRSRGWEVLTGQTAEEVRGTGWLAALHPDDIDPTMAAWRKAIAERVSFDIEFRVRAREGGLLWHRARTVPIFDEKNEVAEWFGLVENIHGRRAAEAALAASEARLRAVVDTAPDAIVVIDRRGIVQSFNQGAERIFGYAPEEVIGRSLSMLVPAYHAGQHDSHLAEYERTGIKRAVGGVTPVEGMRKDGFLVPLEATVGEWFDEEGARHFTGVLRDITERRAAEEKQVLLAREVDHRAKNALAVVQSIIHLTPANDPKEFVKAVERRVGALGRAHSLLAQGGWAAADLRTVAEKELEAHVRQDKNGSVISLAGPPMLLTSTVVQSVAMVLHELTTNAAKHGALSIPEGRIEISWEVDTASGLLRLHWEESGGPPVSPPTRRGFGTRLIQATVRNQLGGTVEKRWQVSGLVCEVTVPLERIAFRTPSVA